MNMKHRLFLLIALCASGALQASNDTIIRHFTDTVTTVQMVTDSTLKQREVVIPTDSLDRRGHYVEAHVGLGYGSLGYSLDGTDNRVDGSFSGLLQLQYAYFFHQNWGIGAGLWFTNYTSHARIGGAYTWLDQTDTDTEQHYDHTATVLRWRERETIHNIGIPISLQFQYKKDDWKARLFAAVGVAPAFSVMKRYKVLEGDIEHSAFYPAWNLELRQMHEFQTKNYVDEPCAKGDLSVRTQVDVFADLGALVPLTKQVDLFLGGYFNISVNDANSSAKQPLGWKDKTFTFMDDYRGAYATNMASDSHPWEAGIKVGIHWHHVAPDKRQTEDYFEYFQRPDTTLQFVQRADTTIEEHPDSATVKRDPRRVAKDVERFNKIYFAFDSYELTHEAKGYLDAIAELLNREPDTLITLDGHASPEGADEYNKRLSIKRARAVCNYLVGRGVKRDRIEIVGHGSQVPNEDKERGALKCDRRVEIQVAEYETVIEK